MTLGEDIVRVVEAGRFAFDDEAELQAQLEELLGDSYHYVRREVFLGQAGRIDFVVDDRVGVEVKIKGRLSSVARQLHGYAETGFDELVLVTNRLQLARLPQELAGVPVRVAALVGGIL